MNLVDDPKLATLTRASSAIANPLALDDVIAEIAARRDEFDQLSHVPRDMIATMKRARIFRASTPKWVGGLGGRVRLGQCLSRGVARGNAARNLRERPGPGVRRRSLPGTARRCRSGWLDRERPM